MSTEDTDRQRWRRIQQDESAALERQQVSAGPDHAPVLGPGPYGDHGVNMHVEAAVVGERQRCAALAREWSRRYADQGQPEAAAALAQLASALVPA